MKRIQRAAVLASLLKHLEEKGSWCGETHMQKATYFLQGLLEVPLGYDFILYKHGPFSFDLSDELGRLEADYLIEEVSQPRPYGPSYRLADDAWKKLTHWEGQTIARAEGSIGFVADHLGDKNVSELERLATALYATIDDRAGAGNTVDARAKWIVGVKPHIALAQARDAVREVDSIMEAANQMA
ncbi:MAG: hypothetical protein KDB68_14465 [Planctomycetes bacterium]|nr:hypothetical protein [Planctomycetota bacterium]